MAGTQEYSDSAAILHRSGAARAPAIVWLLACSACSPGDFDQIENEESPSEAGAVDARSEPDTEPDAGAEPDPTDAPDAAQQAETGTEPEDAGADASPEAGAMCVDTTRDPRNCGTCGYDCGASFAEVSCINARCSRACDAQHDDCNRDLASGSEGDGCETRIDNDIKNCGGCDLRCAASAYGFASCREQACYEHTFKLKNVRAGTLRGGATAGATFQHPQLCPPNEILVGISGISGQGIAYSLRVHCARLSISKTTSGYALKLVPGFSSTEIGGLIGPERPPAYDLPCPEGSIVTGVAGATWLWPGQTSSVSIRQLSLSCATPSVDAERRLTLTPAGSVSIGNAGDATAVPFSDACGAGGAVAGFTGCNGAYIDAVATHCGELAIEEELGPLSPAS